MASAARLPGHGILGAAVLEAAQSLPDPPSGDAIAQIGRMVAPGGTLIVIAAIHDDADGPGPPWPLTRAEVEAFASGGIQPVRIDVVDAVQHGEHRWPAEFSRPASAG